MKKTIIFIATVFAFIAGSNIQVVAQEKTNSEKIQSEQKKTGVQKDSVYYTCPMHPEIITDKSGDCPKCGMNLVKKTKIHETKEKKSSMMTHPMMEGMHKTENTNQNNNDKSGQNKNVSEPSEKDKLSYTCPMHPEVVSDKPGSCPKCGMYLEKKVK